jgi:hypothetical protein
LYLKTEAQPAFETLFLKKKHWTMHKVQKQELEMHHTIVRTLQNRFGMMSVARASCQAATKTKKLRQDDRKIRTANEIEVIMISMYLFVYLTMLPLARTI